MTNSTALDRIRQAVSDAYYVDEQQHVGRLISHLDAFGELSDAVADKAAHLVQGVREQRLGKSGLDAFLYEYDLSSEEGIALMCLAESLLRIPDQATVDDIIQDKIAPINWEDRLGQSESRLVNVATWGLMLTGKIIKRHQNEQSVQTAFKRLVNRAGEPVIRKAMASAMKILSKQFIMGTSIEKAIKRAQDEEEKGYRYSYDMLGEAARTEKDAEQYFKDYQYAIHKVGGVAKSKIPAQNPGISVKLSALHPRYEFNKAEVVVPIVSERLLELCKLAKQYQIGLTVDAEEADRLGLSLDIIQAVLSDDALAGWDGFGVAVQSYQKRAWFLLDWLAELARMHDRKIMVRLIKGAYWDTEIKVAQEQSLPGYPVFTRKENTDVSFLACAYKLIHNYQDTIYPQFATHNAYSVAAVHEMMAGLFEFEYQCLHGMGKALYDQIVADEKYSIPCRVYAPVGSQEDLLAYLVRRLLENGANSSFVNRIADESASIDSLVENPVAKVQEFEKIPHPKIPMPIDIFQPFRKNSPGLDLSNIEVLAQTKLSMAKAAERKYIAKSSLSSDEDSATPVTSPIDGSVVGAVTQLTAQQVGEAFDVASKAFAGWSSQPVEHRAQCLRKTARALEANMPMLMHLLVNEAGKNLFDAINEIREAVDFCRYYAAQAIKLAGEPTVMPGPTGETNELSLHGRGVMATISPWNFPLAIFLGQVAAALVMGNCVLAKPAAQTPLVAYQAVKMLHDAGVPEEVLILVPGPGSKVGAALAQDDRVAGMLFTGSTGVAKGINRDLANREGPIVPFIAETGGQNAMIVDSTALPEQAVKDVVQSAFGSAGQRCSALRVLFLQSDIEDSFLEMLRGHMDTLRLGRGDKLMTDVGPVIDEGARDVILTHIEKLKQEAELIHQVAVPEKHQSGLFVPPTAFKIDSIHVLTEEIFGPVLHVVVYERDQLDEVINQVNSTGYGLTFGVHTRLEDRAEYIRRRIHAGNVYVNRNTIGAVVGVQPFGGEGLSGTGPKAGGPNYLMRLCGERTYTVNTTAVGGNTSLVVMASEI